MDYRHLGDYSLFRKSSYYPCNDAVEAIPVPDMDEVFNNIDRRLSSLPSYSSHLRNEDVCVGHRVGTELSPPPPLAMYCERNAATVSPELTERHHQQPSSMECETTANNNVDTVSPLPSKSGDADVNPLVRTYASLDISTSSTNSSKLAEPTSQFSRRVSAPSQVMRRRTELPKVSPRREAPSRDIMEGRRSVQIVPPQEAPSRDKVSDYNKGAFRSSRPSASSGSDCASLPAGATTYYVNSPVSSHPDMISPSALARDYKRSLSAKSAGSQASRIISVPSPEDTSTYTISPAALLRGYKKRGASFSSQASSSDSLKEYSDASTTDVLSSPLARDYKRSSFSSSRSMASRVIAGTAATAVPFTAPEDFHMISPPFAKDYKTSFNSRSMASPAVLPAGAMAVPFAAEDMDRSSPRATDYKATFSSQHDSHRSIGCSMGSLASISLTSPSPYASTLHASSGSLASTTSQASTILHASPSLASASYASSTLQGTSFSSLASTCNSQAMSSLASTSQDSRLPAAAPFPDAVTNSPHSRPQRVGCWAFGTPSSKKKKSIRGGQQQQPPPAATPRAVLDSRISPLVSEYDRSLFRSGPSVLNGTSPAPRQAQQRVATRPVPPRGYQHMIGSSMMSPLPRDDYDRVIIARSTTNNTCGPRPPPASGASSSLPSPIQAPSQRRSIEITPGMVLPFLGYEDVCEAIKTGQIHNAICIDCNAVLKCVKGASFIICPKCTSISPIESSQTPLAQRYVALGVSSCY